MRDAHLNLYGDRRRAKRDSASLKVYLSGELWSHRGTTRDISRRGVFVSTDWEGYALGTRVDLTFVQKKMEVIELRRYSGIVVRQANGGMALQFCWTPHAERIANTNQLN
ncbi:MAG: PilZ domain-containing protein [Gammaproteobacteria bacterium]|nr:PilZ domain-containing protein [Gammaproteobacteria bacterium]